MRLDFLQLWDMIDKRLFSLALLLLSQSIIYISMHIYSSHDVLWLFLVLVLCHVQSWCLRGLPCMSDISTVPRCNPRGIWVHSWVPHSIHHRSCLPVPEPMSMCNSGPPSASCRKSHALVWASHREWQKRNINLCLICEYVSSYVQLFFPTALLEHNCTSQTQPCLLTSSDFVLWTLVDQKYFKLLMSTFDSQLVSIYCTTARNTHPS